ncbi:MAG: RNA-binding S4 domain-containing protein [Verrucomicrobiota bacterium]|jgi:ribosome-associated heat shock protein Hsp15|nr:RNA-binding S4 domain-containing protein [Verrucomicrobiota bacterium]MDP7048979.1 RNA-binding S4 domain-containing protein [Verrucomicrobiota bacterium]
MNEPEAVRVDKWLFAVRLFKTRSQAADACRNGKVRLNDAPTKAAKPLKPGDTVTVRQSPITRTLKVVGLTERRVGAKLVSDFATDETPPAELEKLRQAKRERAGDGHPTKRNRRLILRFIDGNQP